MIQQLFTISRNTFIECIRQPVFVVLLLATALLLVLAPSLAAYTLEDDNKLLLDMGLSMLFLSGLLLAAFSATGVLATEIENRTVLTVVSKPVARPIFVCGKYVGVAAAIGLAFWALSLIFLLTVRHRVMQTASDQFDGPVLAFGIGAGFLALLIATFGNYFYQWVFTSSFVLWLAALLTAGFVMVLLIGSKWQFQSPLVEFAPEGALAGGQILIALLLVFEAVLILVSIAIATSTRLGQIMTLVICTAIFYLGLAADSITGPYAAKSLLVYLFSVLVPHLQFLWLADAVGIGNPIPASYVAWSTAYCGFYIGAVLCLAVALFQTREVG